MRENALIVSLSLLQWQQEVEDEEALEEEEISSRKDDSLILSLFLYSCLFFFPDSI